MRKQSVGQNNAPDKKASGEAGASTDNLGAFKITLWCRKQPSLTLQVGVFPPSAWTGKCTDSNPGWSRNLTIRPHTIIPYGMAD
jgi:hypothetical protein